ncbi:hypothetical protein CI610_02973 [invertebrate metagenome]|uniref:Uncharacterized protein n=1 Tax=invertebrate metagenome TaxID=1711999 RepID=A0A2H9T4G2_9ZZZZ
MSEDILHPVFRKDNQRPVKKMLFQISEDSKVILSYIDLPIKARKPVGYDCEFFYVYQPNEAYHKLKGYFR